MNDHEENEARAMLLKLIEHCLSLTLRLTRNAPSGGGPVDFASGFLLSDSGSTYLVSAGHALRKPGWMIETGFAKEAEGRCVGIPVSGPYLLKKIALDAPNAQDMDVSWAKIDLEAFTVSLKNEKGISPHTFTYAVYKGPLDGQLDPSTFYAYAAHNDTFAIERLGSLHIGRRATYEYEMAYTGRMNEKGLCVFSVPKHKGHDYYEGASGAPIVDPTGQVFAILVRGDEAKNELYGFPLSSIRRFIAISEDAARLPAN